MKSGASAWLRDVSLDQVGKLLLLIGGERAGFVEDAVETGVHVGARIARPAAQVKLVFRIMRRDITG